MKRKEIVKLPKVAMNHPRFHPMEMVQFSRTAGEEEEVKVQMEPPVEAKVG